MCIFGGVLCELSAQDPIIDSGELRLSSAQRHLRCPYASCLLPSYEVRNFQVSYGPFSYLPALYHVSGTL